MPTSRRSSSTPPEAHDGRLRIQKYPNRRLYDRTRSRHLTSEQLHALVAEGWRVEISDSRTGEDITNVVLAQLLLERDPLKLRAFPPEFFHLLIRASHRTMPSFQRTIGEATAALAGSWAGWNPWSEPMKALLGAGSTPPLAAFTEWLAAQGGGAGSASQASQTAAAGGSRRGRRRHPSDGDAASRSDGDSQPSAPGGRRATPESGQLRRDLRRLEAELASLRGAIAPRSTRSAAENPAGNAAERTRRSKQGKGATRTRRS